MCLAMRAIHIEVTNSLDMGSFINFFYRFMSAVTSPDFSGLVMASTLRASNELKQEIN